MYPQIHERRVTKNLVKISLPLWGSKIINDFFVASPWSAYCTPSSSLRELVYYFASKFDAICEIEDESLEEWLRSYQLVGEVMAHQGYDG